MSFYFYNYFHYLKNKFILDQGHSFQWRFNSIFDSNDDLIYNSIGHLIRFKYQSLILMPFYPLS